MFKKLVMFLFIIVIVVAAIIGWKFFTSATDFPENNKFLYIPSDKANYASVLQTVTDSHFVKSPGSFDVLAKQMDLDEKIRAGKYEIKKDMSLVDIVRMLRNGRQSPVKFTINKVRTKEGLAAMAGRKFECDSASVMEFLENPDSLKKFGLDTNTAFTMIFPNTYTYFWNITPAGVFAKFHEEYEKVWTEERRNQAKQHGLDPTKAYILASIVEEETNDFGDKKNIASVYLNRYNQGMRLQADPTVRFALKDFGMKRIYEKHLLVESPYNTYRNKGLPPGPICTPSLESLDAVLQSPVTNYLYFVAKSDFSGKHDFSATYDEHIIKARAFHDALNEEEKKRDANR
jgi:UPF0755 protein